SGLLGAAPNRRRLTVFCGDRTGSGAAKKPAVFTTGHSAAHECDSDFRATASYQQSVEREQNDRAPHRGEEARRFTLSVPTHGPPDRMCDKGPGDTQERCDNEAPWITSWHQEFGHDPDDQTDH